MTPTELATTWRHVKATEPVTEEPTDGRPLRSPFNIWRRRANGHWSTDRNPHATVPFTILTKTLQLRELPATPDGT
jgi:hypothetical protein